MARIVNHGATTAKDVGIPTLEMCQASHESDDVGALEYWNLEQSRNRGR